MPFILPVRPQGSSRDHSHRRRLLITGSAAAGLMAATVHVVAQEARSGEQTVEPRSVVTANGTPGQAEARKLRFRHRQVAEDARRYERFLRKAFDGERRSADDLMASAETVSLSDPQAATRLYARAAVRNPQLAAAWVALAESLLKTPAARLQGAQRYDVPVNASGAAYLGYQRSVTAAQQARALDVLVRALQRRSYWRPAIDAARIANALAPSGKRAAVRDKLRSAHGFRMVNYQSQSDAAAARVCLQFSERLAQGKADFARYVQVDGRDGVGIETEGRQLCVGGVEHGQRTRIKLRAGLPSKVGEVLQKDVEIAVYVRDRKPLVRFNAQAHVLPSQGQAGIPLVSVNTKAIDVEVFRVNDRALTGLLRNISFQRRLSRWDVDRLKNQMGEQVFQGQLTVDAKRNQEVTTAFPVRQALKTLQPGAYALVAKPADDAKAAQAYQVATQWFIVTDIGLTAFSGDDGVHAFVRSLSNATPTAGATVRLVAKNNEVLAEATTDANGYARFSKSIASGEAGLAPALLIATRSEAEYAFLDLTRAAFDYSDRGVAGRSAPEPIDAYLTTDRGVYRPGEDIHFTALVRSRQGLASDLPATLIVTRPDGVEDRRLVLPDEGLGGRSLSLPLTISAMTGTWRARVHLDPKQPALSETAVLVEDFVPERLELKVSAAAKQWDVGKTYDVDVVGRYLYGPPAAELGLEGYVSVKASDRGLADYPGFVFGDSEERVAQVRRTIERAPNTSADGKAVVAVDLPKLPRTRRPLEATVSLALREPGGRVVRRAHKVAVNTGLARIGVKPEFDATSLRGGEQAAFQLITLGADQLPSPQTQLTWTLSKLQTTWQWYSRDGQWTYEPITETQKVANGTVRTGDDGMVGIEAPVEYGRYRLDVVGVGATDYGLTSKTFSVGWFAAAGAPDSPEMLDVALDQVRYRDGDTAKLRINDRLGGKALISVMAGDLKSHKVVDVPAGQSEIEIDVDGGWGAGAYVTAIVYRSMDVARKRMPSRAVGVAWLGLDQSKRTLQIALQAPEKIGAGETLRVPIKLDGLSAGEKAFVSVSAVDVGIVNLTSHAPANPAAWFTGQTRLSMEMRDYYGRLIDGMRARRGALRTGGDAAGGMAMTGSPPVEATIAEYSGIVEVAADGTAEVAFDLPDFNGRVRLSAMAWSQAKLGHAVAHVTVRDQVAVTAALPRFLTLGDETRLRLDLHNVDGPTGDYLVKVSRGTLDGTPEPTNLHDAALTLAKGVRTPVTVGLKPDRLGRHAYTINVAGPQGIKISRRLTVDVKPPSGAVKRTTVARLESGQKLTVSADLIADLLPEQTDVAISVGPRARFNVPGLLARLERYPYACAEQTISRVLPLVYANNRSLVSGGISAATAKTRVRKAIAHVLQMQDGSGGFGTWGPRNGEIWLTSYVIDFLTRVQAAGYQVPQRKLANALDRLQNYIAYAQDFERGGEARAYALYVLARNKRAPVGELRYYADERLTRFASPLAKAQLAAALGMVGDVTRARRAFDAAVRDVRSAYGAFVDERAGSAAEGSVGVPLRLARFGAVRRDYGSALRDGAAVLALAAETPDGISSVGVLARIVADRLAQRTNTSTQEQAWLVVAANALAKPQKSAGLAVNGEQVGGAFERALTASELTAQPLVVSNTGEAAVDAVISITGAGRQLEPAVQRGYDISRRVFTLDGREVASTAGDDGLLVREVAQNDRLVIVVDVTTKVSGGRLMLVDHLPAGFEIENPRLLSGSDVSSLSWLRSAVRPEHTQFRDDRMVAAFNLNGSSVRGVKAAGTKLSVAYMVRAVSPGRFMRPGAVIEDMYRPETHARTEPGVLVVSKADQN